MVPGSQVRSLIVSDVAAVCSSDRKFTDLSANSTRLIISHRIIICIGSAVIASSMAKEQFIAGRFILGFGVSILTCAAPSYIIEVAPPQWRGRFAAFYNCGWFGGSIPGMS